METHQKIAEDNCMVKEVKEEAKLLINRDDPQGKPDDKNQSVEEGSIFPESHRIFKSEMIARKKPKME